MNVSLAIALFKLALAIIRLLEQQRWYQQGKAAADAEANAEELRRIELADAARADHDNPDGGMPTLPDPRQRD